MISKNKIKLNKMEKIFTIYIEKIPTYSLTVKRETDLKKELSLFSKYDITIDKNIKLENFKFEDFDFDKIYISKPMKKFESRIALTFTYGMIENGIKMQQLGQLEKRGYTKVDLLKIKENFSNLRGVCQLVDLSKNLPDPDQNKEDAYILVIRDGIDLLKIDTDLLFTEQINLEWDKKKLNKGLISNSVARRNLCYADFSQQNNYADFPGKVPPGSEVKGTIINFADIKLTCILREKLDNILPKYADVDGGRKILCEGNLYYDDKSGIGYHGDTERRTVICCSLGSSTNLDYQWYQNRKAIGKPISLTLNSGDIYIMSEKATGNDWKKYKNDLCTLRHSAGALKFRTVKK